MKRSITLLLAVLQTALAFTPAVSSASLSRFETHLSSSAAPPAAPSVLGKTKSHEHCKEAGDRDILVRAARGETVERTPVWLMRQAGRYMAAFREYSDKIPFRQRSETPDYAVELSLQCHRAYGLDGIIMFSDILTPLPCLGIDFDVVKGTGPVIQSPTEDDLLKLPIEFNFDEKVPFIREILQRLRKEAEEMNTSLIGFVGAPFTLAAYSLEGKSSKHCETTKDLILRNDRGETVAFQTFMDTLAEMIGQYACHQIESGAEVIQIFDSWAHQLSPDNFERYAKPAVERVTAIIKAKHPTVPVIYFANGGSGYLEQQKDMSADMICLDWAVDMAEARKRLGDKPVSGNLDPLILKYGSKEQIEQAVRDCIDMAGGPGKHLLNLGHGVMQGTPEVNVKYLVDECKRYKGKSA